MLKNKFYDILFAFIIAFLIYQGFILLFSTSVPLTSIVSTSMEHRSDFDTWWDSKKDLYAEYGVSKQDFQSFRFSDGFYKGDIAVVLGAEKEDIKTGDIVVYRPESRKCFQNITDKNTIIHRAFVTDGKISTIGDSFGNPREDLDVDGISCIENGEIEGKAVFILPYLGYPRFIVFTILGI